MAEGFWYYKLGMECNQIRQTIKYDDKEIQIYCTVKIKNIAEIRVQFKFLS
jgi:hypothetical protein